MAGVPPTLCLLSRLPKSTKKSEWNSEYLQSFTIRKLRKSNKTLQRGSVLLRMPKPCTMRARLVDHIKEQEIGFH